jgi:hypothetical protein
VFSVGNEVKLSDVGFIKSSAVLMLYTIDVGIRNNEIVKVEITDQRGLEQI